LKIMCVPTLLSVRAAELRASREVIEIGCLRPSNTTEAQTSRSSRYAIQLFESLVSTDAYSVVSGTSNSGHVLPYVLVHQNCHYYLRSTR
jgi:hypothetical protein